MACVCGIQKSEQAEKDSTLPEMRLKVEGKKVCIARG